MIAFLCLLIAMLVQKLSLIIDIVTGGEDEASMVAQVRASGWRGVSALISLAALIVILPVLPALAPALLIGLSYGIYWGTLIFLAGIAVGNFFVFVSVRELSGMFAPKIPHKEKHKRLLSIEQLEKIPRPEIIAFFVVMIPGLSSAAPYLFAETTVPLKKYLIAAVAGSIPTTLIYVFLGDRIYKGNYGIVIAIVLILLLAILILIPFRKKILDKLIQEN